MSNRNPLLTPLQKLPNQLNTNSGLPSFQPPTPENRIVLASHPRTLLQLNTLHGQFAVFVSGGILLTVGSLLLSFFALNQLNSQFNEVIHNSAPSIIAAQQLGQAIQDADAKAGDYQLFARLDSSFENNKARSEAWNTFLKRRREVNDALFAARSNITYAGETDALNAITDAFLNYVGRIEIMRNELDQGHPEAALAAYKSAHDILVGNLNNVSLDEFGRSPEEQAKLKGWSNFDAKKPYLGMEANVQKLSEINRRELKNAKDASVNTIIFFGVAINVIGILLLLMTFIISVRYALITHRVLNHGYVVALLGAFILYLSIGGSLSRAKGDYKSVAEDSFISIEASAKAQLLLADANADETRLLLSPEAGSIDLSSPFLTDAVRKAYTSASLDDSYTKKMNLFKQQVEVAWGNVTYPQERIALCNVAQNPNSRQSCNTANFALDTYLKLDVTIRDNFRRGQLAEAIKINTGASNIAAANLESGMKRLSTANEVEFDLASCNAIGRVKFGSSCTNVGYIPLQQIIIWAAFPFIALALFGGFWFIRREL